MEKINVLIVEDKHLIAEGIASILKKNNMEVTGIYDTGEEALASLEHKTPNLVVMDIKLAGALDGISTARLMVDKCPLPVIYLSDYADDMTVERAAKTLPANYLSKPFTEPDLIRAIRIAFTNFQGTGQAAGNILSNYIFIKAENAHIKLAYDDIIYLQAGRSYCNVITEDKTYMQSTSMNHVLNQINHKNFVRIHRSHVINVTKITKIDGNMVSLGKYRVEMSKSMREELMGRLKFIK